MDDRPRTFVVTGATGHLGRAVVDVLSGIAGSTIIGASRASMTIHRSGQTASLGPGVDLGHPEGAQAVVDAVIRHSDTPVSVVNCVGYFPGYRPFIEVEHNETERVFRSNFLAVSFTALSLVPLMIERGGGDFLAFTTLSAKDAVPLMAAFDSSKVALEQFIRHLANEYGGRGIRANALALATLRTTTEIALKPRGDHARWVEPSEVAYMACQLVTGALPLLNGNVIRCYHYSESFFATSYFGRVGR